MKLFKKTMVTLLALSISATMVACGPKNKTSKKNDTQKIEYITEITKDNVEEVVIEYKEILSYYNDLKNNLKTINDVSKNPDLERDAVSAKDSIKNSMTLLQNTETTYKPLMEAKSVLLKMYKVSLDLSDTVVTEPNTYQQKLKDYDKLFEEFKDLMDKIRSDIKNVRGKAPTDEKTVPENENTEDQTKDKDKNNKPSSDINSLNDDKNSKSTSDKNNKNDKSNLDKPGKTDSSSGKDQSSSAGSSSSSNPSSSNDEFVPHVSSLNNSLRGEIRQSGHNEGLSYKQNGGSAANLDQAATQTFNELEGDNPIQDSQVAEARAIFVNAFKQAYNSN